MEPDRAGLVFHIYRTVSTAARILLPRPLSMSIEDSSIGGNGRPKPKTLRLGKVSIRIDWPRWLRLIQRKRRLAAKPRPAPPPEAYFAIATLSSFQLEGIPLNQSQVN